MWDSLVGYMAIPRVCLPSGKIAAAAHRRSIGIAMGQLPEFPAQSIARPSSP